jgi:hypothetical protein
MIMKIFGPKGEEATGGFRKLHNEELHNLCSSPSIIIMVKSRRMSWAEHVVCIAEKRNIYRISAGNLEGKRPQKNLHVGRRVILK